MEAGQVSDTWEEATDCSQESLRVMPIANAGILPLWVLVEQQEVAATITK